VHPVLAFTAILCIAVGAGASGALNMAYEGDIDALMTRTANRPIPRGRITSGEAMAFGLTLAFFSVMTLGILVNWRAGALLAFTIFFYTVIYTVWLKRRTAQNIVIGGAAGAIPTLSGWAAANGHIGLGAVFLFSIVLVWTPPHFWALALLLERQYAAARIPMMPVVRGARATARRVVAYSVVLVAVTVVPGVIGTFGVAYLVAALALGVVFIALAWHLWRDRSPARAAVLFHFSLLYLALLFVAVALDAALR
jgi:protoheme IX farnesyltransferase